MNPSDIGLPTGDPGLRVRAPGKDDVAINGPHPDKRAVQGSIKKLIRGRNQQNSVIPNRKIAFSLLGNETFSQTGVKSRNDEGRMQNEEWKGGRRSEAGRGALALARIRVGA